MKPVTFKTAPTTLECPCCGDEGAVADVSGYFTDGQPLTCGCPGMVSVDTESDPFINNGDEPCPKCAAPTVSREARQDKLCSCRMDADAPNEFCEVHGWPKREASVHQGGEFTSLQRAIREQSAYLAGLQRGLRGGYTEAEAEADKEACRQEVNRLIDELVEARRELRVMSTSASDGQLVEHLTGLLRSAKNGVLLTRGQIVVALEDAIWALSSEEPNKADAAAEWKRRFERSQQRWGNLKARIKGEIESLSGPGLNAQQRSQYQNGIARLKWVLHQMEKSPDVLAEALSCDG